MNGRVRIVNDPIDIVPLLVTFKNSEYKKIYEMLNKSWCTEEELRGLSGLDDIGDCITILKKGNLIEEQWRMPKSPGLKPVLEYHGAYSRFRAAFQCNLLELGDLLNASTSNDEMLRETTERVVDAVRSGKTSISELAREFSVSPVFIKGLGKRIPALEVKGQEMVLLDGR